MRCCRTKQYVPRLSSRFNAHGLVDVILSGLADLRAAFNSSGTDSTIPFNPRCTISLPAQPNHLCFASNDTRLLVGLTSGSIAIYDTSAATSGASSLQPLHVFSSPSNKPAREISANPGDIPDLVAVLYEAGGSPDSPIVELLDVQKLQVVGGWTSGSTFGTIPTAGVHCAVVHLLFVIIKLSSMLVPQGKASGNCDAERRHRYVLPK